MKLQLILISTFLAGSAAADRHSMDKAVTQSGAPAIGEAINIEPQDVKTKRYIGETEKNLQKSNLKNTNPRSVVINHEEQYIRE